MDGSSDLIIEENQELIGYQCRQSRKAFVPIWVHVFYWHLSQHPGKAQSLILLPGRSFRTGEEIPVQRQKNPPSFLKKFVSEILLKLKKTG